MINGGSLIVSPLGTVLAGPSRKAEDILTAELDLDDIARGKFDLDSVGHYARPDGRWSMGWMDMADWDGSVFKLTANVGEIENKAL